MPEQSNQDKLESIFLFAPADELPGLLETARLIVRVREIAPAKTTRPYVRKANTETKGAGE